ncbi:MAG: dephospho-CoA kinase [Eggerthellaceae bacterium]|nr:dephospho-CoA kinase [Eggerthellaceae bacterium]
MKTLFIIGGMGAGKSTVARCFVDAGIPTLDLDTVGHAALGETDVKAALVGAFGDGILDGAGAVDRKALAACAFASPEKTAALVEATNPAICDGLAEWLAGRAAEGCGLVAVEVSAFDGAQGSYAGMYDCLVAVCAPAEARLSRAVAKGFPQEDVRRRLAVQPTDTQWRAWADYVIDNDGDSDHLLAQAEAVLRSIQEREADA